MSYPFTRTPNKERIAKWIDALRSGRFKQGTGALRITRDGEDLYCCLGVACEVATENGLDILREASVAGYHKYDDSDSSMPLAVQKWYGFNDCDVPFRDFDKALLLDKEDPRSAIAANDSCGWDFNRIADKLEQHFGLTPEQVAA